MTSVSEWTEPWPADRDGLQARDRWRLATGLTLSVLIHGLLLSLTFGDATLGLPGFALPWADRRVAEPDLRVRLLPAPAPAPPAERSSRASTELAPSPAPRPAPADVMRSLPATEGGAFSGGLAVPTARSAAERIATPERRDSVDRDALAQQPVHPPRDAVVEREVVAAEGTAVAATDPVVPDAPANAVPPPRGFDREAPATTPRPVPVAATSIVESTPVVRALNPVPTFAVPLAAAASTPQAALPPAQDAGGSAQEVQRAEAARVESAREEAARIEAARIEAERLEAGRQEQRRAAELAAAQRREAEREQLARLEAARVETARVEAARLEAERQAAERQAVALAESRREQTAREEAARVEAARLEADRQEAQRRTAELAAAQRREAEREQLARLEAARIESARLEAERLEAARQDAARQEAERQEAARQEVARQEATRQEAARQEATRQEAARQEAARQEAARQEAARLDVARQEAARQRAVATEAARPLTERPPAATRLAPRPEAPLEAPLPEDAVRVAVARPASEPRDVVHPPPVRQDAPRSEAEQEEARREARLRAIGRQLDEEAAQRDRASRAARTPSTLPYSLSTARRVRVWGRTDPNIELIRYVEAWTRKIEFEKVAEKIRDVTRRPHTPPMVTVAVRSDGSVESVTFVVSSGLAEVDDAIRRIVDEVRPYLPFPPALARDVDVIEIRRTWYFDAAIRLN